MVDSELYFLLRLSCTPNIGYVIGRRLLSAFNSAEAIFKASKSELLELSQIGTIIYDSINKKIDATTEKYIQSEINFIKTNNISVLSIFDEKYPEHLLNCYDAPFLLFTKGNIELKNRKVISIVGTRNLTKYGASFCEQLVEDIADYNPVIVSGLALGTDILAHKLAIKYNLQTIAVLPTGLNALYPKQHARFSNDICLNGGFITEFWNNKYPEKENFVKRNRIIAGISVATVLIESALKGGSLLTTNFANDYNREVFALPGRITDVYSKGCNELIKNNQASLLNSSSDLIKGLNWDLKYKAGIAIQTKMFLELTATEQLVYNYIEKNGKSFFDTISISCNMSSSELSSVLLTMELNGLIKNLPGRFYDIK